MVALDAGTQIAGYILHERLGVGGFGEVWVATDARGLRVAFKMLRRPLDDDGRRRFRREGAILRRLQHPNIVGYVDAGELGDGAAYLVTEYVDGVTLQGWLGDGRAVEEVLDASIQLASCLTYAHENGVAHRDLKPANVLVEGGSQPTIKVLDFGIAKLVGVERSDITKTGTVIGSAGYMSPEQLRGLRDVGPATDQYNLGLLLFEMLTDRPPFDGSPIEVGMAHIQDEPPTLRNDLPAGLADLVYRLLAKDPADRYQSMRQVHRELERIASGDAPRPVEEHRTPPPKRSTAAVAGGAVVLLAAIGFAAAAWLSDNPQVPPPNPKQIANPLAAPVTVPARAPDATATPAKAESCRFAQRGLVDIPVGNSGKHVLAYVPRSVSADSPDVVVMLRYAGTIGDRAFVEYTGFDDVADATGAVLLVPSDDWGAGRSWDDANIEMAWRRSIEAMDELCIEDPNIFVLAEHRGGQAADFIACNPGIELRAMAVSGNRYREKHQRGKQRAGRGGFAPRPCEDPRRVPYMYIDHSDDPLAPLEGGSACAGDAGDIVWSLARQTTWLKRVHSCGEESSTTEHRGGTCTKWKDCDAPLQTCLVTGGRDWNEGHERDSVGAACVRPPSAFDYTANVWAFFTEHGLGAQRAVAKSKGCGKPVEPDIRQLAGPASGSAPSDVLLPRAYDHRSPRPLVVYLRDDAGTGASKPLPATPLGRLTDRDFVLVAPASPSADGWPTRQELDHLVAEIGVARASFCIDTERIYIVGEGERGASAASRLRCRMPRVAAITTTLREPPGPGCELSNPPPSLHFKGSDDAEDLWTFLRTKRSPAGGAR